MKDQDQEVESATAGRATLAGLLKHEITRLSRKVLRSQIDPLRKAMAQHRGQSAELKRRIAALQKEIASLKRAQRHRGPTSVAADADDSGPKRWQAKGLVSHRKKLGLSADHYARLVGVSSLSIYNWEQGKIVPRRAQQVALSKVRGLGKREAARRLADLAAENPSAIATRKPRRASKPR
jgi:DNA-binding transcriptional regulator YiaG